MNLANKPANEQNAVIELTAPEYFIFHIFQTVINLLIQYNKDEELNIILTNFIGNLFAKTIDAINTKSVMKDKNIFNDIPLYL